MFPAEGCDAAFGAMQGFFPGHRHTAGPAVGGVIAAQFYNRGLWNRGLWDGRLWHGALW